MVSLAVPSRDAASQSMGVTLRGSASSATEWMLDDAQQWLIAVLKPARAALIAGLPGWQLTDRSLAGAAFMDRVEHAQLMMEMGQHATLARRILVLERCIGRLLAGRVAPRADAICSELRRLLGEGRGPKVGLAAQRLGLSERQLERSCKTAFGLSPSQMIRLMRLHAIAGIFGVALDAPTALADLAWRFGFSDASHLSREVKTLMGMSTRRWRTLLKERRPCTWPNWLLRP